MNRDEEMDERIIAAVEHYNLTHEEIHNVVNSNVPKSERFQFSQIGDGLTRLCRTDKIYPLGKVWGAKVPENINAWAVRNASMSATGSYARTVSLPFCRVVSALEMVSPGRGWVPGTSLVRVVVQSELMFGLIRARQLKLAPTTSAWCLSLGRLMEPAQYRFHGIDIAEVAIKAVKELLG